MAVLVPDNRRSPTGTYSLSENYRRALQRPLNQLITDIRTGVIEEDVFGLKREHQPGRLAGTDTLATDDLPPLVRLDRTERQVDAFDRWLKRRIRDGVLETINRNGNTYVRSAYSRGLRDSVRMTRAVGGSPPPVNIEASFNMGVHRRTLKRLYQENFEDLEDISREMSRQVRDELTTGLARGENPRTVARRLTDRVDKIGRTRAETMARTRLIDSHSAASLRQYEQMSVGSVTVTGEILTAGDDRVCPLCQSLAGERFTIREMWDETFSYRASDDEDASLSGDWPIRPPIHARCRCAVAPVV